MTRHAFLALVGMMLALWAFSRACNTVPAESRPPSATWVPSPFDPLGGRAWLPVTGAAVRAYQGGAWSWVDVAVARAEAAGKPAPTAAPTATRTGTPTATRPPRATRTARATGTPTQGRMATVPACGPGTLEPGDGTPHPGCWPYNSTLTATPTPVDTDTPTPRDTPPASATWEPTPTPRLKATPAAWVPAPETWRYRFPLVLVWRRR